MIASKFYLRGSVLVLGLLLCVGLSLSVQACRVMMLLTPGGADSGLRSRLVLSALAGSAGSLKAQSRKGEQKKYSELYTLEDLDKAYETYGNPDGWGIVAYAGNAMPTEARSALSAAEDKDFDMAVKKLAAGSSDILLAHIRLASDKTTVSRENTHPFVKGNWSFMHNGVLEYAGSEQINSKMAVFKDKYGLSPGGSVDSELAFNYFLGKMEEKKDLMKVKVLSEDEIVRAFTETAKELRAGAIKKVRNFVSANPMYQGKTVSSPTINFVASNGDLVLVYRKGRNLFLGKIKTADASKPWYIVASDIIQPLKEQRIEWFEIPENYSLKLKRSTNEVTIIPPEE